MDALVSSGSVNHLRVTLRADIARLLDAQCILKAKGIVFRVALPRVARKAADRKEGLAKQPDGGSAPVLIKCVPSQGQIYRRYLGLSPRWFLQIIC